MRWENNARKCKCRGCQRDIEKNEIKLSIYVGNRSISYVYICEECFQKASESYENG